MKTKSDKGITVITLVITIIIMLILAGIVINLSLGENGLIAKAQEAKNKYISAESKENIEMELLENQIGLTDKNEISDKNEPLGKNEILYYVVTSIYSTNGISPNGVAIMPNYNQIYKAIGDGKCVATILSDKIKLEDNKLTLPKGSYTFESYVPTRGEQWGAGYKVFDSNGKLLVDHTYTGTVENYATTNFELEELTDVTIYWYRKHRGWLDLTYYKIKVQ